MSPQARMAAGNAALPDAGVSANSDAGAGPFVINLTSSTSPMALAHPDSPELKRFSFFVSRRREDNRERFRLHMGYFATLAEAEEWLNVIRDLYPGAWAGEAPGKKLRARAAATELAKQLPAPPPSPAARTSSAAAALTVKGTAKFSANSSGVAASASPAAAKPAAVKPAAPVTPEFEVPTLQAAPKYVPPTPNMASAQPMLEAVAQAAAALAAVAKTAVAQSAGNPPGTTQFTYAPPPAKPSSPEVSFTPATYAPAPSAPPVRSQAPKAAEAPAPRVAAKAPEAPRPAMKAPAPPVAAAPPARAPAGPVARASAPASIPVSVSVQPKSSAEARAAARPPAPAPMAAKGGKKNVPNAMTDGSNVREVMASLDIEDTGQTRQMRIPPGLRSPAPAASPPVSKASPGRTASPPPSARNPAAAEQPRSTAPASRVPTVDPTSVDSLSDTGVLRMLEVRRSDESEKGTDDANQGISMLKPDDTQTRRALKEAVIGNAPVSFAVQLQWSVQPVDLASVPPLAIFSAYTLYTVEGSREGRKWYGLRLGFFSDAISAKQVAYYVRSEFTSVAVVPVSPAEKSRASDEETKAATGAFQRKRVEQKIEEFKLFEEEPAAMVLPSPKAAAPAPAPAAAKPAAKGAAPARKGSGGRVRAKEQRSPKTLEETLEILGASDLEIDNGRGELLNDTGVRHLRVEVQKNTPFAKLLDRISERVRKN
jgi:hypothetical protein